MARFLAQLIAASLIATPSLATGFLRDLSFPQPDAPITQSNSG